MRSFKEKAIKYILYIYLEKLSVVFICYTFNFIHFIYMCFYFFSSYINISSYNSKVYLLYNDKEDFFVFIIIYKMGYILFKTKVLGSFFLILF